MKTGIALVVSYDGAEYVGFQSQPGLPSIQGKLEEAIAKIVMHPVHIIGSGRTDSGVHANGQVVCFRTDRELSEDRWPLAINACLPSTIRVRRAYIVDPGFHAISDAITKTYRYEVCTAPVYNVHLRHMQFHFPQKTNFEFMRRAAQVLVGRHDFRAFCVAKSIKENNVRTIHSLTLEQDGDTLRFQITGDGFLHNMVRIIVGTLLFVGTGKISVESVHEMLTNGKRIQAGMTAPAHGLMLWSVKYSNFSSE